ncbi:hypothetical protein PACID_25790 [Acidipropionibacterium acidipropionici ATCC 4875]|uniref:Uncharacterized protein n=1 Tax=Acidipropionibacterium acidipropionici (strain ATCC 4875 / DSM 20272 / JCM 6432 / NBRC 12425 / NCIMB 8070 / 4) TaxID=1171373 RepID=K7SMG2_ACIA4|nr:hypothetical protein PACID_25790 [Acidipropionibacterium acidipropionici ATCC 4875]
MGIAGRRGGDAGACGCVLGISHDARNPTGEAPALPSEPGARSAEGRGTPLYW